MIEVTLESGDKGHLIVQDNTDGKDKTVDLYLKSDSVIAIPQLPWTYSLDGVQQPWRSFNFQNSVLRQYLGKVFVGYTSIFTLHLGKTNTTQMGGPTNLVVDLNQHGVNTVSIFVDNTWKKAVPFVRDGGVWKPATAFINVQSTWKETS